MSARIKFEKNNLDEYCLSGILDRDTVPSFWRCKRDWLPIEKQVTLNLSTLDKVDSAGMVMLLHLQQHLKKNGQLLTIRNIPLQLSVLLKRSNANELFLEEKAPLTGED